MPTARASSSILRDSGIRLPCSSHAMRAGGDDGAEDLGADKVVYAEVRYAPEVSTNSG